MLVTLPFLNRLYFAGLVLSLALVIADFFAFFFVPDTFFHKIFIATKEQTPLTWLSAVSFLMIALAALSIASRTRMFTWHWLAIAFAFFSLDDASYLHERLAGYFRDHTLALQDFPSYLWVVLYAPLLITSLGFLLVVLWRHAAGVLRPWVTLAVLALALAFGLDFLDGLIQRESVPILCLTQHCQTTLLHLFRLTEELLEVWATGLLGYLLLREYCLQEADREPASPSGRRAY